jgi:hypothetical protein
LNETQEPHASKITIMLLRKCQTANLLRFL